MGERAVSLVPNLLAAGAGSAGAQSRGREPPQPPPPPPPPPLLPPPGGSRVRPERGCLGAESHRPRASAAPARLPPGSARRRLDPARCRRLCCCRCRCRRRSEGGQRALGGRGRARRGGGGGGPAGGVEAAMRAWGRGRLPRRLLLLLALCVQVSRGRGRNAPVAPRGRRHRLQTPRFASPRGCAARGGVGAGRPGSRPRPAPPCALALPYF